MNESMKLILKIRYCIDAKYETFCDSCFNMLFVGPFDYYWEYGAINRIHFIKEIRNPNKLSLSQFRNINIKQLPDSIKNFLKATTWLAA